MTIPAVLRRFGRAIPALRCALAALALLSIGAWPPGARAQQAPPAGVPGPGKTLTPSCPAPAAGNNYSGKTLVLCNFNRAALAGANFTNATLTAVAFDGADLRGTVFDNATINDSGDPMLPTDFGFANLSGASFVGTQFNGLTYFANATLSCANFQAIDLTNPNVVFGPSPLVIDPKATCTAPLTRTSFARAKMNCDFFADWPLLDLSYTTGLTACSAQLLQANLSGAVLAHASLSGIDLTGTTWTGADLQGTDFSQSTLQNITGMGGPGVTAKLAGAKFSSAKILAVDFSNAQLYGAKFNGARIENSRFAGADLTNNTALGLETAADFSGARLKNVDMSSAKLNSATFNYASLFGSYNGNAPTGNCNTDTSKCPDTKTGFTCGCASLSGAKLISTVFSNAFLYGVDFSGTATEVTGTQFDNAILVAANFSNAPMKPNPDDGGKAVNFSASFLQGSNFSSASLSAVNFTNAFFDFGAAANPNRSNTIYVSLPKSYVGFPGWTGPAKGACAKVEYASFGSIAGTATDMTCPNGSTQACGATPPAPKVPNAIAPNPVWQSKLTVSGNTPVSGNYRYAATYEGANLGVDPNCKQSSDVTPAW